ncbi:uncharacterized protein JN550_011485 [Neoarthrinium moseri]|nr:uncharacterized protein JN550_011485 [Neoarthrinium moseri]KAI1860637.1 hypothetical protein JN550_011485 [Neoarthrinium moseri]
MASGLILEILAFVARIQLHFRQKKFLQHQCRPAFFSAAIYLCLARVIAVYGGHISRLKPRTYTITFMMCDAIALVLQASGGALVGGDSSSSFEKGLSILRAGLAFHVAGMVIFVALASDYAWSAYRRREHWTPKFSCLQESRKFHYFLIGLIVATLCIFIRTCYRLAELSMGLDSDLANDENAFMVLEGGMVAAAVIAITILHPGVAFERFWPEADFQLANVFRGNAHSKKDGRGGRGSGLAESPSRREHHRLPSSL